MNQSMNWGVIISWLATHVITAMLMAWGGGGGGTEHSFIQGGSAPRSKPLPFYIPFLIEKVPLSYTFDRKLYPFSIPTERLLLNLSLQKPLNYLDELAVECICTRYFESPFLYLNDSFPSPFVYFNL